MGVSKNNRIPKSSILVGFPIINHPFWGTPIFGNIHMDLALKKSFEAPRKHMEALPQVESLHLDDLPVFIGLHCILA